MTGQRLSQRTGKAAPDGPFEGVPEHLIHGLRYWFEGLSGYRSGHGMDERRLRELAVFLRSRVEPNWSAQGLMNGLLSDAERSDDDFLDLVDGALQIWNNKVYAQMLSKVLAAGGSVWTAAEDGLSLVRVVGDEAQTTYDVAVSKADEISTELREAWSNAFGRSGDPSDAWDHAIKALEDMLIPAVVPNQSKPNLGHVVGQLRNQPNQWRLVLPGKDQDHDVAPLVGMLDLIWPNHDRHGGPTPKRRPSNQEARAVVTLTATIVQWYRDGWIVQRRQI
ncbi:hypothetical protein [Williamsia sp. 1135]|uniref:hypothetical protein n=1 Tax=Williamsia sp. 1135 TaxID=1889262 RepID=UPI00117C8769|nr:hypothetical protein [Williamsia sp. 1135]